MSDTQTIHDMHNLSIFLATHNKIKESLRNEISKVHKQSTSITKQKKLPFFKIDGYEELLTDVINICQHMLENKLYLSAPEKHMYVKVKN